MKAGYIHKMFDYHFSMNRKILDVALSTLDEVRFSQDVPGYGGSVHRQLVHMINIDGNWIKVLAGEEWAGMRDYTLFPDRESVRKYAHQTETMVREFLSRLDDETLITRFSGLGKELQGWEILFHIIAHGIDHRSLLLTMLNQLEVETFEQDYVLYAFGGSWPTGD